jgi:cell division protein FtsL
MKVYENDEEIIKLNTEIKELKKTLQSKVQEYGDLSHPEVVLISNKLDQKIFDCMRLLHPLDRDKK